MQVQQTEHDILHNSHHRQHDMPILVVSTCSMKALTVLQGCTCLIRAARNNCLDVVQELLSKEAKCDATDERVTNSFVVLPTFDLADQHDMAAHICTA